VAEAAKCERCGQLNAADQRFCGGCGAPLVKTCPACGHANAAGFRFCGSCGSPLGVPPVEERRRATVVFADLSGFTRLSETLDPEEVTALVDRCMHRLGEAIERYGGVVANVAGDGLLAVFGVPRAHEDDPERAVHAGLEMQRCAREYAAEFGGLELRVGVNTGEMMFAPVGPDSRREPTVHGDAVNTASRLESAAPVGGVLVGAETYRATRSAFAYEPVTPDAHQAEGRARGRVDRGEGRWSSGKARALLGPDGRSRSRVGPADPDVAANRDGPAPAPGDDRRFRRDPQDAAGRRALTPRGIQGSGEHHLQRPLPSIRPGHHFLAPARDLVGGCGNPARRRERAQKARPRKPEPPLLEMIERVLARSNEGDRGRRRQSRQGLMP
jgi:class 3 adenylate cyclase